MHHSNLENTDINSVDALPFSQACENNKDDILSVLKKELKNTNQVLEVGSGTGQHGVYFAPRLSHLQWQASDLAVNHGTIKAWHDAYPAPNLHAPLDFDLRCDTLPISPYLNECYDAVFTANTLHIVSWELVKKLFALVGEGMAIGGKLIIYGPFNENGQYTSVSNHRFDIRLRQNSSGSAIRDKEAIIALADEYDLILSSVYAMPANNQILVFKKSVSSIN